MTLEQIGERALIERIRARLPAPADGVAIGIGDDAAVVQPVRGRSDVLTTDSLVEDVHFRRAWSSLQSIGRKAVLVNLSDLAAMGARPRALLLSLCMPAALSSEDFDELIDGVTEEMRRHRVQLIGGNISRSPGPLMITITAVGFVHRRRVLTRAGGRSGDELYITGTVGGAAAGLAMLEAAIDRATLPAPLADCVARHELPAERGRCGQMVADHRAATACMDLSDGLADAVRQMASASGTGATLQADAIPIEPGAREWWESRGSDPVTCALAGGEDYELLFAVPARRRRSFLAAAGRTGTAVCRIGSLQTDRTLVLRRGEHTEPLGDGFRHFNM